MRKLLSLAVLLSAASCVWAQSGTNSPYSQLGLGQLSEQSSGFNRGMNGLALGFHEHNQINTLNPASYSQLDSLTFIFDMGMSGQITNFKEGGRKINANNADFEYAVAGFRAMKNVGVSFGILPYTNIGYNYSVDQKLDADGSLTAVNTYNGTGGLHIVYLGAGWQPLKGFSLGANIGYLWGDYTRTVVNSYSNTYANSLTKRYTAEVRNYKLDFGVQYSARLSKKDELTLGATYSLGHDIGGDPMLEIVSQNSQTNVADTATFPSPWRRTQSLKLAIPHSFGVGVMYNHDSKLKLGFDYNLQKWASVSFPDFVTHVGVGGTYQDYEMSDKVFKDRHKFTLGAELCPDENSHSSLLKRIRYRAGVSYVSPYLNIDNGDGPKELSASIGFGIPIMNTYNNRSILNISAQWVNLKCSRFVTENTFRINIGLTFNERWFAKWKVE